MEAPAVIAFRLPTAGSDSEAEATPGPGDRAITEIDAAIALVGSRIARRVRLTAIPFVEVAAATGLAHARVAGVGFSFERGERTGVATVTVGPIE